MVVFWQNSHFRPSIINQGSIWSLNYQNDHSSPWNSVVRSTSSLFRCGTPRGQADKAYGQLMIVKYPFYPYYPIPFFSSWPVVRSLLVVVCSSRFHRMARAGASSSWCPGKTARTIRPRRRSLAAPMPGSRNRLGPGCSARQRACIACRTKQMKKKTTREIQKRNQSKCSWRSGTIYKLGGQEQNTVHTDKQQATDFFSWPDFRSTQAKAAQGMGRASATWRAAAEEQPHRAE